MYPPMAKMPIASDEFPTLFLMKRTWASRLNAARFGWLVPRDKLKGSKTVGNGAAI